MSQLLQMRNRIKAIETIEKITHAMQLISMSTHVRLREKKARIEEYQQILNNIFNAALAHAPHWNDPIFIPQTQANPNPLIILIGSQKGLCGTFNIHLFERFEKDLARGQFKHASVITVGKKAIEYLNRKLRSFPIPVTQVGYFDPFNYGQIRTLISFLRRPILEASQPYSEVIVYNNYSSTFFTTKHEITTLIPLTVQASQTTDDFVWEDDAIKVLNDCAKQLLDASLYILLTKSLLAEQAARFVSMDNATRNAKNLRDSMKLQYNKIRQAKITKELTELSGSFQQDLSP